MIGKIYISGKITGLTYCEAFKNFEDAEKMLAKLRPQASIINPMKLKCEGTDWKNYMVNDIAALLECDTIYLQPNWRKSKGAKIERFIARQMDMIILTH